MFKCRFAVVALAALVFLPAVLSSAQSAPNLQWVGTWATASMLADGPGLIRMLSDVTLRQIAHISVGGAQVRIRFTNEYGLDPLTISDAHVALSAGGSSIKPGSDHAITFGGAGTVNVPPGWKLTWPLRVSGKRSSGKTVSSRSPWASITSPVADEGLRGLPTPRCRRMTG